MSFWSCFNLRNLAPKFNDVCQFHPIIDARLKLWTESYHLPLWCYLWQSLRGKLVFSPQTLGYLYRPYLVLFGSRMHLCPSCFRPSWLILIGGGYGWWEWEFISGKMFVQVLSRRWEVHLSVPRVLMSWVSVLACVGFGLCRFTGVMIKILLV